MVTWENLDTLDAFKKLSALKGAVSVKEELSGDGASDRVSTYSVPMASGLVYNYAAKQVDAKVIVIGKDFRFGNHRKGNVELLKKLAPKYGYQVVDVEKITIDGQIVSSTRIRKEIKKGNMEKVTELLEMPYTITGEVLHGQQLGRTIGMPTINQAVAPHKIIPPKGVYVSKVYLEEGVHGGITNLGIKPTVSGEKQIGVETYIFDFDGNLYGKVLKTELLCFVRGEKKFPNLQSLKEQIYKDRKYGEEYIAQLRKNCLKNKI